MAFSAVEQPLRVALNLVFLVPGETGGMETYARELIPRLARRGDVASRLPRQPRGRRGRRRALGLEAPDGGRARARAQPGRVGARRAAVRAAARRARRLPTSSTVLASHRAAVGSRSARHDDPRPQLPAGAGGALRPPRARDARARAGGGAALAPDRSSTPPSTRDDLVEQLGVARAKIDVVPLGVGQPDRAEPTAAARAARAARRSASAPLVLTRLGQAAAQEPRAAARRAGRDRRPSGARCSSCPGYPTPHEARAARARRGARRRGRRALAGWLADADLEGLYAARGAVRVPVALRGLRAARARGDGARRAGRLLGPRRRCRRSRATPRCCSIPRTSSAIAAAIERLLGDPGLARTARATRGASAPRTSPGSGPRSSRRRATSARCGASCASKRAARISPVTRKGRRRS